MNHNALKNVLMKGIQRKKIENAKQALTAPMQ